MFHFSHTPIAGVIHIAPYTHSDERGFFMETYSQKEYALHGIDTVFVQKNHSQSHAGVLRGLHFQTIQPQAKLVRVVVGSIYDVAVDLRTNSVTYGHYFGIVLSAENKKQLFIPKGFAHGFLSLENNTEVVYLCDDYYCFEGEGGILYNDIQINIPWGAYYNTHELIISEKDHLHPTLADFHNNNPF